MPITYSASEQSSKMNPSAIPIDQNIAQPHQRNFMQQKSVNTETHNWTTHRKQEILGHSDLNVISSPEACLHVRGSTQKRGCWKTPRKQCLPDKDEGTYELTEAVAACTRTAQVQGKLGPDLRGENGHRIPLLTKKLFAINTCWEKKN